MSKPRAFTLLEVLLAAALLALVVAVCLPLIKTPPAPPQPVLEDPLTFPDDPDVQIVTQRFDADVGTKIQGEWILIEAPHGMAIVWREHREPTP
jgi:prepilin-type N-terminal cleavage/methylation domain-containing protein